MIRCFCGAILTLSFLLVARAEDFPKPYSPPCVEREQVFEFTEKPVVKPAGRDRYEISFAVKGNSDVTVGIVDSEGKVVRHLGSGVLGSNAPVPFQKNSLKQTIYWNGKDDLDEYVKDPGKLKVRVMVGLKPEFDRVLMGSSPKNLPGGVWGIVAGPDGVYVFAKGSHISCRKFDHNGKYVMSLIPPPADLPAEQLGGLGFVEFEKGLKATHGVSLYDTIANRGLVFPTTGEHDSIGLCAPAISGQKLYFAGRTPGYGPQAIFLHKIGTDGSTGTKDLSFQIIDPLLVNAARLALSPDGKTVYVTLPGVTDNREATYVVWQVPSDGSRKATGFAGEWRKPGSDNAHFGSPECVDCDEQGRVYVCDKSNSRIQIYSPDGKYLKTLPVDRPDICRINRKTGELYVLHQAMEFGKSFGRLTKFSPFDSLKEVLHSNIEGSSLSVDEWAEKTRLWIGGGSKEGGDRQHPRYYSVRIFEDDGKSLALMSDFQKEAAKEEGANYFEQWGGISYWGKVVCDPVREQAYYGNSLIFDLKSGKPVGRWNPYGTDDIAFDKRGYMHCHFNPMQRTGVGRVDPGQKGYPEVPYDYGEVAYGWRGVILTKDQAGAKSFQDGIGVNMRGELAVESNIYYMPKMESDSVALANAGANAMKREGHWNEEDTTGFMRRIEEMRKRGEEVYSIRPQPGIPLAGATVWTYERNGELRKACAATVGSLINGVQIDEDGSVYFVNNRPKVYGDTPFLYGRGGVYGVADAKGANRYPYTGSLIKAGKNGLKVIWASAPMDADPIPSRPPDIMDIDFHDVWGKRQWCWIEGAEWIYAGASPIVQNSSCSCPTQRFHLDWYKRSFVPEAYRHSFGVVDTAGNLIMHLGQYGNYDSGFGAQSKRPVGGDNIALFMPRFIGGTDNYIVFVDWGERLVSLKLNYHAEALADIRVE